METPPPRRLRKSSSFRETHGKASPKPCLPHREFLLLFKDATSHGWRGKDSHASVTRKEELLVLNSLRASAWAGRERSVCGEGRNDLQMSPETPATRTRTKQKVPEGPAWTWCLRAHGS